jgi:hypothetical protein
MKWITNVGNDNAFAYLMKYCIENPNKHYILGRPAATKPSEWTIDPIDGITTIKSPGLSVEQLEQMNICGLYEV